MAGNALGAVVIMSGVMNVAKAVVVHAKNRIGAPNACFTELVQLARLGRSSVATVAVTFAVELGSLPLDGAALAAAACAFGAGDGVAPLCENGQLSPRLQVPFG